MDIKAIVLLDSAAVEVAAEDAIVGKEHKLEWLLEHTKRGHHKKKNQGFRFTLEIFAPYFIGLLQLQRLGRQTKNSLKSGRSFS